MTLPLCSIRITRFHRYYGRVRPCAWHWYSHSRGVNHLNFSLDIQATGSHVPKKSLKQRHATSTPDTTQPISRHPLGSFPRHNLSPGFDVIRFFISMLQQWFACARLTVSYLTSLTTPFPLTLTTPTLYRSSLGWFKASPCRAALEGLPPSLLELQHFQRPPFLLPCLVAHRLL